MSAKHLLAIALAMFLLSEAAEAGPPASPGEGPAFTAAEDRIIARNEVLAWVARTDPRLARDVLDALAALDARPDPLQRSMGEGRQAGGEEPAEAADPEGTFDPGDNPDLRRLERAAPEALHDLFQLLKQASGGKPQVAK